MYENNFIVALAGNSVINIQQEECFGNMIITNTGTEDGAQRE